MTAENERPLPTETDLMDIRERLQDLVSKAAAVAKMATDIINEATDIRSVLMFSGSEDRYGGVLKKSDGRLNDKGISVVNAAFSSGMTVTDVAKKYNISNSAASNRRRIWLTENK